MKNQGIYVDSNNTLQISINGQTITSDGTYGKQQYCPKGGQPCQDIGCCMQNAAVVQGMDDQEEDDDEEEDEDDEFEDDDDEYYGNEDM